MTPDAELDARTSRTKTGTCTVTEDRILITRTGLRGAAAQAVSGHSAMRLLAMYGAFGLIAVVAGFVALRDGAVATGAIWLVFGGLLLVTVFRGRDLSATPVIERSTITRIEARPPRRGLMRGYFVVHFTDQGRKLRRNILLPGVLENGVTEYEKACRTLGVAG